MRVEMTETSEKKTPKIDTILSHIGINHDEATGALISPIHLSTTYQHPEFGQSTGYEYTRTKNPTRSNLEEALAAFKGTLYPVNSSHPVVQGQRAYASIAEIGQPVE